MRENPFLVHGHKKDLPYIMYTLLFSASGDHNIFTMRHTYSTTIEMICTVQKITTIQGNYTA